MQLSKFTSSIVDIVTIYRSQTGNLKDLNQNIEKMMNSKRPLLIVGDFNFCFQEDSSATRNIFMPINSLSSFKHQHILREVS